MDLIVEHVLAHTMQKVRIKEFVCYFKFRDNDELYVQFCQVRIHSISFFDQGSPAIVMSGNCRVALADQLPENVRQDITFSKTKPKILQKRDQCALCYQYFSHEYELNPLQLKLIIDVALFYDKADEKMFRLSQKAANGDQVYVG